MIETETTKNDSGENQQVNNENSIPSLKSKQPTLVIVNCLGYKLGDKDIRGLRRKSPTLLKAKSKGLVKNAKNKDLESKSKTYSPAPVHECSVLEKSDENLSSRRTDQDNQAAAVGCHSTEVKSGKGGKKVIGALQNMCLAAGSLRNNNLEEYNDSDSNAMDDLTPEKEKEVVRPQLDYSSCDELQQRSMVAAVTQQSTLHDDARDEVIPCPPTCLLAKENIENQNMQSEQIENQNRKENQTEPLNLPSECIENQNRQENQTEPLNLFDQAHSSSSLETYVAKFLPEDSSAEMKTSLEFVKDNTRKRKQLILLDGYDGEEKKAGDVQPENNDPRSEKCDTPMKNNEIENTVQTGDLCNVNLSDGMPVKKRRYVDAYKDKDDDAVIDVANGSSAQDDVTNCTSSAGANLESQAADAEGHPLGSRITSDSDTSDQQHYIYIQPRDEPVWSGAFKINSEVFGKLDAYLSNKACQKVWDLSRMLQPVVEVVKLPWWQAWPRKWTSAAPTDDCIGLFFSPRSSRPNEESTKLVNKIIESDDALNVTVGVAELIIFPSTLLRKQNQLFQGKYYLRGALTQIVEKFGRGVLVGEQNGLACAAEECSLQEHHLLYQQDGVQCESSGQETSAAKPVMHVQNDLRCLELFPVRQEKIGWAPRVEGTKEVDFDLSLGARRSRVPSVQL